MIFKVTSHPNHSMILQLSNSHSAQPVKRLEVHEKLGGDTEGTADPNPPNGYPRPYDTVLRKKSYGEESTSGVTFQVTSFIVPNNCNIGWSLAFLKRAEHLSPDGH